LGEGFQTFIRRPPVGFALVIAGLFALVAWSAARDAAVETAALAAGLMLGWINLQAGLEAEGALRAGLPVLRIRRALVSGLSSFVWDFQRIVYVIPWSDLKGRIGQWRGDLR